MILLESNFWNYSIDAYDIKELPGSLLILAINYIETGFLPGFVLREEDNMLFAIQYSRRKYLGWNSGATRVFHWQGIS